MAIHYVAVDYQPEGGQFQILGAYETAARARRAIDWQRKGGFEQPMYVCKWSDAGHFYFTTHGLKINAPRYTGTPVA